MRALILIPLLATASPVIAKPFGKWFDCYAKVAPPTERLPAEAEAGPVDPNAVPLDGRRVPGMGGPQTWDPVVQANQGAVAWPKQGDFPTDHLPVPDRWRLVETLGLVKSNWKDPYNQNTLKGDRPVCGTHDLFVQLTAISDTLAEPRSFPTPVGVQTTERPGSNDTFGRQYSEVFAQTFILGAALTKGSTAFKPPEYELRAAIAFNMNHVDVTERRVLSVLPSKRSLRTDAFVGVQELFLDYHLRNTSDRYDFDSLRIGIQPFSSDFRGFLFQDNQLGLRLFGNRDNNRFQYNLAAFWRLEKDSNSGLNAVITLGCLIKGETMHFEYICEAVAQGIMRLNLEGPCPVVFGVLAVLNEEQARARGRVVFGMKGEESLARERRDGERVAAARARVGRVGEERRVDRHRVQRASVRVHALHIVEHDARELERARAVRRGLRAPPLLREHPRREARPQRRVQVHAHEVAEVGRVR